MRIWVFGAGAMGSMIGGLLSRSHEVTLIGRREHVTRIRESGLRITGIMNGIFHPLARESVAAPEPDLIIITVKSYDTPIALETVEEVAERAIICLMQNGLQGYELLKDRFAERGVIGLTSSGVTFAAPGEVHFAGIGETVFGSLSGRMDKAESLSSLFESVGLPARATPEIIPEIWMKAIVNASINPLTTLIRSTNGHLMDPGMKNIIRSIIEESTAVAGASGIRLPPCDPYEKTMAVIRATRENKSSMLQDVIRGRRTEIEEINGEIVRKGKELGVPTPVNTTLLNLVRYIDAVSRKNA